MNSEQLKGFAAFKKRASANVCVQKKSAKTPNFSQQPALANNGSANKPRSSSNSTSSIRSDDISHIKVRFAILAKAVRYLRHRHQCGEDHFLSVDQIIEESNQLEVSSTTRKWLATEAFLENPKIEFSPDKCSFRFKPLYRLKDGKALIRLLKQQDLKGLGGINLEDVKESLPNIDAVLRKYSDDILCIDRPLDKKTILYYNDRSADFEVDDEFRKMWRMVPVENVDDEKIEEHLEKQGIRALQGDKPKFKAPKPPRGSGKRRRLCEAPRDNVHVASVLKIYDDNGALRPK